VTNRKVLRISDDPHFADYAELQTPPVPEHRPTSASLFWAGVLILAGCFVLGILFVRAM